MSSSKSNKKKHHHCNETCSSGCKLKCDPYNFYLPIGPKGDTGPMGPSNNTIWWNCSNIGNTEAFLTWSLSSTSLFNGEIIVPTNGIIENLYIQTDTQNSTIFSVYVNGNNSLTPTVTLNAQTSGSDLVTTFNVNAGDSIAIGFDGVTVPNKIKAGINLRS